MVDEAIDIISDALGPKWTNMYKRLGTDSGMDYRDRFQLQTKWKEKEPDNLKIRNKKCALEVLQKWRRSVQGKDEQAALLQLLNALCGIPGLQTVASDLALKNGLKLYPSSSVVVASETSSDEMESYRMSFEEDIVIQLNNTNHKFAILDISQRLDYEKFVTFCRTLSLPNDTRDQIQQTNDLHEEQFYLALKYWINSSTIKATFNQLINCLKHCNEGHLIRFMMYRLNT